MIASRDLCFQIPLLLILLLLLPTGAAAQYAVQRDSAGVSSGSGYGKFSAGDRCVARPFRAGQIIAPAALIAGGMGIHYFAHDSWDAEIRDGVLRSTEGREIPRIDDYVQYAPMTMHLALGLAGAKCRLGFMDRLMESLLAHAVCGAIAWPSKQLFHTLRPNGYNYQSFPSGHTSFVFTGAELMRIDYSWGWGLAGYGVAAGVGFSRIWRNWHWLSDVLFGAGIGILSANAGSWLLQPVKDLLGIDWSRISLGGGRIVYGAVPTLDPFTRTAILQFSMVF